MFNLGRLKPAHIYFIMATEFTKQKRLMSKQHQYDIDSMKVQAELNRQQWETENEYNLPVNQKQRLMAAGMNPLFNNLDGTSSSLAPVSLSNNVDAAGTYAATQNAKQQKVANMQALAKGFAEIANLNAQTDAAKAQAQNSRHDTLLKDAQANVAHATATGQSMQNASYQQQFESEQQKRASEINLNLNLSAESIKKAQAIDEQILNYRKERDLMDINIEKTVQDILNGKRITDAQVNQLNSAASANYAAAAVSYAVANKTNYETKGIMFDNVTKLWDAYVATYTGDARIDAYGWQNAIAKQTCLNLMESAVNKIKEGANIDAVINEINNRIHNADLPDSQKALINGFSSFIMMKAAPSSSPSVPAAAVANPNWDYFNQTGRSR